MNSHESMRALGKLRPLTEARRFDLESATQAQAEVEAGRARGMIVIDVRE